MCDRMMRLIKVSLFFGILSLPVIPALAQPNAIEVEPNPSTPGRAVTFRWYFTGTKVVVSGGRFGRGINVTGRTSLIDHPRATTRYTFNVWYRGLGVAASGHKPKIVPLYAKYSLVVVVVPLAWYHDPHGWYIGYLPGWKHDNVYTPDEGSDGLVYFQQADDSIERLAVAIFPVKDMTADDLMAKVATTLPDHYDEVKIVSKKAFTYQGVPAVLLSFSGLDQTHPGTRTRSVVLVFVHKGRGYVISARTLAARFQARSDTMLAMVKSFGFTKSTPHTPKGSDSLLLKRGGGQGVR